GDVAAKPLETRFAGACELGRRAIDRRGLTVAASDDPAFGREHHFWPPRLEHATQEPLVGSASVNRSSVEEGDAYIERSIQRADRFSLVARSVALRHAHAPEAHGGHDQPARSQFSLRHLTVRIKKLTWEPASAGSIRLKADPTEKRDPVSTELQGRRTQAAAGTRVPRAAGLDRAW